MSMYEINCEVIDVNTESGICPGIAKTETGENFTLGARTPAGKGICTNSLPAIYPMSVAMRLSEKMDWEEKQGRNHFDITCPHGAVTYRISRIRDSHI